MTRHAPCGLCDCEAAGCRACLHEPERVVHVLAWRDGYTVVRLEAEALLADPDDLDPRASIAAGEDDLSPVYRGPKVARCALCETGARHTVTAHEVETS